MVASIIMCLRSIAVAQPGYTFLLPQCTQQKMVPFLLDTMADNAIAAMRACWCKRQSRTQMSRTSWCGPPSSPQSSCRSRCRIGRIYHLRFSCTLFEFGGMQQPYAFTPGPPGTLSQ
jgi:hypothetical protein